MSRQGRSRFANALSAVAALALLPAPAAMAQDCAALPPRDPMPREARPERLEDPGWLARTAELSRVAARGMGGAEMIFLGDSIIQSWHPPNWAANYAPRGGVNFGVSGDFVQGLLWRLQEGGQWPATLRPKLAVLLIGTNNASYNSRPEDTALGIAEVVRLIRRRSPATRVLLLGILPRGADATDPARRLNTRVNGMIARCADNEGVFYAEPGPVLLDSRGRLSEAIAPDRLHLSPEGYARLSAALEPTIRSLLSR